MPVARAYFGSIPSGQAGVRATLKIMTMIVRSFLSPPSGNVDRTNALVAVRTAAQQLVQRCAEKDYWCEALALHAFVRDAIRYTRDMRTAETIQTPDKTLAVRSGDCDDKSVLLSALAESIGFPTRFCAIGVQGQTFSHVSAQLMIPKKGWINAETIPIDEYGNHAPLGWVPPDATCVMFAHV